MTVVILVLLGIKYVLPLALPFILAYLVAAFARKPINYISDKVKIKRSIIAFVTVTLLTVILLGMIGLLIYSLYAWLSDAVKTLPQILPQLTGATQRMMDIIMSVTRQMPQEISESILKMPSQIISSVTVWITSVLSDIASKVPSTFIAVAVTVIASFLITRDYYKLGNFIKNALPERIFSKILKYRSVIGSKSFGMIKGCFWLTVITFAELLFGFALLGIKYFPAVAAIVAFVDMLPILGTGTVLIPWAIIALIQKNLPLALGLSIIYAITAIVRNALSPKVLGSQMKLDTLSVLVSMYIGFGIFGITGMIFAPFIAAVSRDIIMDE